MFKELEKEILKLRVQLEKETNKDIRKVLLEQKKHLEQMRSIIGNTYMKYADDEGKIVINSVDRFNTMRKVEKDIVNSRDAIAKATVAITTISLLKSYVDSYYKTANIIDKGVSININYKLLRPEFVESVINANFQGQNYSNRIWKNEDWLANKLYDIIGKGITEGTSIQNLSKEIKDTFGSSAYQAKRLVNTEMARIVSNAQDEIYKDSGVVQKVMYNATLDDRTSEICIELDGQIFDINTNYPKPPQHPNCRSVIIPVVEGWNPRTRRDNITKENIKYTDYKSWKEENKAS